MPPTLLLIILLTLLAARLSCDGYVYVTGHDLPWQWTLTIALCLAAILPVRQGEPTRHKPAHDFWKNVVAIWAVSLVLLAALLWLVQNTRIDPGLSKTQFDLGLRIAVDIAYLVGAAIMLRVWRRERHAPPTPSSHRTEQWP